jgi:hypothetical protein
MDLKVPNQKIELIALDDMEPDTKFQRPTKVSQVESIVKKYDDAQLGVITVSWRDGKYQVIDGAHRAKSLRDLGYTHAYCVVLNGLNLAQEADYFRKQNQDRRQTTIGDNFKAGITAEDEQVIRINEIAMSHGFHIGTGVRKSHRLRALTAVYDIVNNYGYEVLDATLKLIAATWPGIRRAAQAEGLVGIAEFASRFNADDFPARMKDRFASVWYEYTVAMSVHASISTVNGRKTFCRVLVEHYNKGLGSNSKRRLRMEEMA